MSGTATRPIVVNGSAVRAAYISFRAKWLAYNVCTSAAIVFALLRKANFDPNQPRVPEGNADGGQWTDSNRTAQFRPITGHYRSKPEKLGRAEKLAR
jgi:hypothetical protein